jgi:hypothetical protein
MRRVPDKYRLVHGPYEPPPLRQGGRATSLYRDTLVVITAWSGGRISWPRCRALGVRGGSWPGAKRPGRPRSSGWDLAGQHCRWSTPAPADRVSNAVMSHRDLFR